jgi:hypothetical protein
MRVTADSAGIAETAKTAGHLGSERQCATIRVPAGTRAWRQIRARVICIRR